MKLQAAMIVLCVVAGSAFATPSYQVVDVPGAFLTQIWGMNDSGQVVGEYQNASGSLGFIYDILTNHYTLLNAPAYSINDFGTVGGDGYIYSNGVYTSMPGGVWGINDSGQLAVTEIGSTFNIAVRRTPNGVGGYNDATLSIGSFGTDAGGLNNNGDMVGYYQTPNYGSFLWRSNGTSSTFNVPNDGLTTQALGINNFGVIVGSYFDFNVEGHITGYIDRNGVFTTDIDPPGSNYTYLTDINDLGTAVGWYQDSQNGTHGFIMTGAVDLPEPGTIGLALIGLGAFGISRRWRNASKRQS